MKRIALFMHGGIASPGSRNEVPALAGLVERLARRFRVTVYTVVKADGWQSPFGFGGADVRFVQARDDGHPIHTAYRFLQAFGKDHRREPYALVHGFWGVPGGFAAVVAGIRHGVPSVVSLLGGEAASLPEIGYGNMRRPGPRWVTLWACDRASALTVLTQFQLSELRRHAFRREEQVSIIPFGADGELFPLETKRQAAPPYRLLHVGHCSPVKDQATLLQAFALLCGRLECELRIVGEGTLQRALEQFAGALGIGERVTFAGFVPHREMRQHYAWADILLHTSLYEGEGVVFAEAAASGVPICGTRVGLLSDLGASFAERVEPGDPERLAGAVLDLLCDRGRMERMRIDAHHWAKEHGADWSAGRFAEVYEGLLQ